LCLRYDHVDDLGAEDGRADPFEPVIVDRLDNVCIGLHLTPLSCYVSPIDLFK
jgi:hypothetical protein